jgi:NAD-dependent deacetylase
LKLGDTCEKGAQLRPNIVWFGEMVPLMDVAIRYAADADLFLIVGTSLVVYPAAGLIRYVANDVPKFVVDPKALDIGDFPSLTMIVDKASTGMEKVRTELMKLK